MQRFYFSARGVSGQIGEARERLQPTRQNLCRGNHGDLVGYRELASAVVDDVTAMNDIIVDTCLEMLPGIGVSFVQNRSMTSILQPECHGW